MADAQETDVNVQIWKIKKLIKALEAARGNGTSMISLIMPPCDRVSRVTKMLGDEFGTASNIKSRVHRQSVLGAITSAQQRLILYNKVPPIGLVIYTGTIVTEDGKEKRVTFDFEPFRPINASLYLCDNKFHTEALNELIESENLADVIFEQEKRLIGKYLEEISQDTGKYVVGVDNTMKTLEMGAVEILIVWENLDITRYELKNATTGEIVIKHMNKEQEANQSSFQDPVTNAELEVKNKMSFLEWLANDYDKYDCTLVFVTNKSEEGSQFCSRFTGIGGILRYQLDVHAFDELSYDGEVYEDSD